MKRLFTLLFAFIISQVATAQLVVYSEVFDEYPSYSIMGWTSTYSGSVPWQAGLPAQVGGCMAPLTGPMSYTLGTNKVAAIADCGLMFDQNNIDVFSYTPHISLTGISGAWLKYDSYFNKYATASDTEKATVEISTDGGTTWAILQDVPASAPFGNFTTYYIDLSAYSLSSDVRIGFRYSDGGGWLQGWAIDNIEVFVPAHKDLALKSVTPIEPLQSYVMVGGGIAHHATVFNAGLDTIHSFILNYRNGSSPIARDTITGVTLLPFSTNEFAHAIPDSVFSLGNFPVTMWVSIDSDAYHYNDTAFTTIRSANFIPRKRLALESGEGTWYSWTPRNATYMAAVPSLDIDACLVSVHDHDPMTDSIYNDYLFNLSWNYLPYILFDRRVSVPLDSFFQYLQVQKDYFGFADIQLDGHMSGRDLTMTATVIPAVNLIGDHRLALVITEDTVRGTDAAGYAQINGYAGGAHGAMGGFETKPNPVPADQMYYNYVGRHIGSDPEGFMGCLPTSMLAGGSYDCELTATLDPSWNAGHLHAMVFLIRHDDSSILNSNKWLLPLTANPAEIPANGSGLYPNPTDQSANVFFTLSRKDVVHVAVTDLSGRTLYQYPVTDFNEGKNEITIPVQQFSTGIYLVNIFTSDKHQTFKLEVLH